MKRIVFAKLKGGVGASCSLLCLGMYLAKVGRHSVACLDLDEAQQTAANMLGNLDGLIEEYEGGNSHDYLLIDSGAGLPSAELKRHMTKADLIVVPARPSSIDWNSTFTFLDKLSPTLRKKTRLLFTNVMPNTKLAENTKRTTFKNKGMPTKTTAKNDSPMKRAKGATSS